MTLDQQQEYGIIDGREIAEAARLALEEKHGEDTVIYDVRGISPITDYTVVVSGSSPPHLKAMFAEVQHALKSKGMPSYRGAGTPECGWLVLDYVDAVIHIFERTTRERYAVEELWAEAPRLT